MIWSPEDKERILAYAEAKRLDFSSFINYALQEQLNNDAQRSTGKPVHKKRATRKSK